MNVIKLLLACGGVLTALAGCSANHNTAFRNFNVDDGSGAMVDIKQRAVVVSRQTFPDGYGDEYTQTIVCTEPSPDALSAYAAELAAEGGNGQIAASLAAATQETASYVGLRTQSIQLLRDAFYRACEGYMNGALSSAQFDILTRRYQRYMVALLGIEQLTGAVKAPAVTLTTEGTAEAARSLSSIQSELEATNEKIQQKEQEKQTQQNIATGSGSDAEKAAATKKVSEITRDINALTKNKDALESSLENTRGLVAGGSSSAHVSSVGLFAGRSDATIENIAVTVGKIVDTVLQSDDLAALCIAEISQPRIQTSSNDDQRSPLGDRDIDQRNFGDANLGVICAQVLRAMVDQRTQSVDQQSFLLQTLQSELRTAASTEDTTRLVEAFTNAIKSLRTPVSALPE